MNKEQRSEVPQGTPSNPIPDPYTKLPQTGDPPIIVPVPPTNPDPKK